MSTASSRGNTLELTLTLVIAIAAVGFVYFRQTATSGAKKSPWGDIPDGVPGDGFFGYWQGRLHTAPVGPLGDLWNFTLTENVPGATVPTWYGENTYESYLTTGGAQWYWVQFDQNMTTSNITYCGELRGFVDQLDPVRIRVGFPQVRRNDTYIEWYLDHHFYNLTARLFWKLLDGGRKMQVRFTMPADNIVHADLIMWRVPAIIPPAPSPVPCDANYMNIKGDPNAPNYTHPIPLNLNDMPIDERYVRRDRDGNVVKARLGSGCPLGFDKKRAAASKKALAQAPREVYMGYQHCYLLNPTMNYTVRFNMSNKEKLAHVLFSATAPKGIDINTQWLALGISPQFPFMQGMDVILGYFAQNDRAQACVRSMYAEVQAGAPIPNEEHHQVYNRSIWTEGRTMYVRFSRPYVTGYNDIFNPPIIHILPSVAWAMGPAPADCFEAPGYHHTRGVYGWNWTHITDTLPPHMMCQAP
jgi:hypothetical protein